MGDSTASFCLPFFVRQARPLNLNNLFRVPRRLVQARQGEAAVFIDEPTIRDLRIEIKSLYSLGVKAVFVELPAFERHRADYLDDDAFRKLQGLLMLNPEAGDAIPGTGGLRKLRFADERRGKGKRGGLRIIYYWWGRGPQFWLFTIYDKDEMSDLTADQRKDLKEIIKKELDARRKR